MNLFKKIILVLLLFLFTDHLVAQIDFYLEDTSTNEIIYFDNMSKKYNLDTTKPTIIITWSGKWCFPCITLIDRYNKCDNSLINLITINVDKPEDLSEVNKKAYHKNWNNALNFNGLVGKSDKRGFDNIFKTDAAPLIIHMENGVIKNAVANYQLYPHRLILSNVIDSINFIWDSSEDLNSLAWYYYKNVTDVNKLKKALLWTERSIELDENYYNKDTHASLLFKTGEYTLALKKAKEAIEIAKKNGINYDNTNELIQKIIDKL